MKAETERPAVTGSDRTLQNSYGNYRQKQRAQKKKPGTAQPQREDSEKLETPLMQIRY